MSDQKPGPEDEKGGQQTGSPASGSPFETNDVSDDAQEALRQYREQSARHAEQKPIASEGQRITGKATLRVNVKGAATPMMVVLVDELIIGRRDPSGEFLPGLDLTVYGAYQMGVSRQHAAIRVVNQRLALFDLGSRNGTYLNGHRIAAHQPTPLNSGDDVRVGKISMTISVQGG